MPFQGDNPMGTAGGSDSFALPQIPETFVKAEGMMYYLILRTNGTLFERNRDNVEDVIRILGLRGEDLAGVVVRQGGTVIDGAVGDISFQDGLTLITSAPGAVFLDIETNDLLEIMFRDGAITLAKLAVDSVDGITIADGAISDAHILFANTIAGSKFAPSSIGSDKFGAGIINVAKLADNSLVNEDFADNAIAGSQLADLGITLAKIAASTVTSDRIINGSVSNVHVDDAAAIAISKLSGVSPTVHAHSARTITIRDGPIASGSFGSVETSNAFCVGSEKRIACGSDSSGALAPLGYGSFNEPIGTLQCRSVIATASVGSEIKAVAVCMS